MKIMGHHQNTTKQNKTKNNVKITGVPEGGEKNVVKSLVKEIMAENFPNLGERFGDPS